MSRSRSVKRPVKPALQRFHGTALGEARTPRELENLGRLVLEAISEKLDFSSESEPSAISAMKRRKASWHKDLQRDETF